MNTNEKLGFTELVMQIDTIHIRQHSSLWRFNRSLVILIAILLFLPVVLLPLSTSVPAWVWIVLALTDVILLILQFRLSSAWRGIAIGLAGMVLVGLIAISASQIFAATPPIKDSNGKLISGSITTLEKVNLNGTEKWITIRGHDVNKPILLNLGMGGPGGGGFATRSLFEPLEEHFVVVSWDEPGKEVDLAGGRSWLG
jgi:hypothetical protein